MRFVFPLILCLASVSVSPAWSQQAPPAAPTPLASGQYEYAMLLGSEGGNAVLDYGQSRETQKTLEKRPPAIATEQEMEALTVRKLERVVPALNYLSSRGWECLGLSGRQQGSGSTSAGSFSIYSATEYLLRRRRP